VITSETRPTTTLRTGARGSRWLDVTLLALGAILLRLPAYLAPTNLGYDDGGYGLAAIAMRQGYDPFRDVFSSQGPLFLPLVRLADLAGFETLDAPRLLAVAAGAVTTVAVYFAGRELMDRGRALLAAVFAGSSGVLLWTTGPLTSDGVGAAISVSAVAVALVYRRRPSTGLAITIAILAGSAFSVKNLLVTPALVTAWLLVLSRHRIKDAILVPLGAVVVLVLVSSPWGFNDVYLDSIKYHLAKTGERQPLDNLAKLVTTYWRWSLTLVSIGAVGLVSWLMNRPRWRATGQQLVAPVRRSPVADRDKAELTGGDGRSFAAAGSNEPAERVRLFERWFGHERILWWWAGLVVVVLLAQNPMFRNHLAALVPPLALLVARYRPSWRAVAITALITLPYQVYQLRPLLIPKDYSGRSATIVDALRKLPPGAWALSDEPGLIWRAGKATDPFFVDPSVLRIGLPVQEIAFDRDRLLDAAANPRECAVAVTSRERFGSFPDLPEKLAGLGYEQTEDFGRGRGLWIRRDCAPSA
jgi:4-amino-4-deoxy-L-arabinose transferase-like glycosyltransferase